MLVFVEAFLLGLFEIAYSNKCISGTIPEQMGSRFCLPALALQDLGEYCQDSS